MEAEIKLTQNKNCLNLNTKLGFKNNINSILNVLCVYLYFQMTNPNVYSLQIFGYDSLWYNCSIVVIIYIYIYIFFYIFLVFPCFILLFVLVICAFFHTCMFLMELSLLIKNLNLYYSTDRLVKCEFFLSDFHQKSVCSGGAIEIFPLSGTPQLA